LSGGGDFEEFGKLMPLGQGDWRTKGRAGEEKGDFLERKLRQGGYFERVVGRYLGTRKGGGWVGCLKTSREIRLHGKKDENQEFSEKGKRLSPEKKGAVSRYLITAGKKKLSASLRTEKDRVSRR